MDDKISGPTDGLTGEVKDKDGNPIPGSKVEITPDGEVKVTVPEGTDPQDGKVTIKDKDGKDLVILTSRSPIRLRKPRSSLVPRLMRFQLTVTRRPWMTRFPARPTA
ncbi:Ig-like domain-containing protein [Corynebacterium renale]|uniref:Ig-like domain-containing protein n=1 Tax=Corynebacterium renale TaxID=1724 RepID=UPI000E073902|nr:Ig-like domain-containing protein [Corynebacterium renale]STD70325.1 Uncharacterised protein [Corynebacterium renale]